MPSARPIGHAPRVAGGRHAVGDATPERCGLGEFLVDVVVARSKCDYGRYFCDYDAPALGEEGRSRATETAPMAESE